VVWGSKLVLTLMDRFPAVITVGAGLLGWIAGGMFLTDPVVPKTVAQSVPYANYVFAAVGAAFVVGVGKFLGRNRTAVPAHDVSSSTHDH